MPVVISAPVVLAPAVPVDDCAAAGAAVKGADCPALGLLLAMDAWTALTSESHAPGP